LQHDPNRPEGVLKVDADGREDRPDGTVVLAVSTVRPDEPPQTEKIILKRVGTEWKLAPNCRPPPGVQTCRSAERVNSRMDADEDGDGGDDAADASRSLVATKGRAVSQRELRGCD
jgi:hypothetical protein